MRRKGVQNSRQSWQREMRDSVPIWDTHAWARRKTPMDSPRADGGAGGRASPASRVGCINSILLQIEGSGRPAKRLLRSFPALARLVSSGARAGARSNFDPVSLVYEPELKVRADRNRVEVQGTRFCLQNGRFGGRAEFMHPTGSTSRAHVLEYSLEDRLVARARRVLPRRVWRGHSRSRGPTLANAMGSRPIRR